MANTVHYNVGDIISKNRELSRLEHCDVIDTLSSGTRMPALILMDASGSLAGHERTMQDAIESLYDSLFEDNYARSAAEVGIMSFNETINILAAMRELSRSSNNGKGIRVKCELQTLTGLALAAALDHLEKRINVYRDCDMRYYSPILFFFSDGIPYVSNREIAEEDMEAMNLVLDKIAELVEKNLIVVICYELGNECDHELMRRITGLPDDRHVKKFSRNSEDMAELFKLTSSMIISSSQRGTRDANSLSIDEILGQ